MADYIRTLRKMVGDSGMPLIAVGAGVLILDGEKRVLLQHRNDSNTWSINGGGVELGEKVEDAARREVFEETNLKVGEMKLFNVYSGEEQHHIYPDGNEVYIVSIVFISRDFQGTIRADKTECKEVRFFDINNLPELIPTNIPILRDLKSRINEFF